MNLLCKLYFYLTVHLDYFRMGKTRAEIQKEYRERKKLLDPSYTEKERKRKKDAYIPAAQLSATQLKKRRIEVNQRVQQHYARRKEKVQKGPTSSTRTKTPLVVKLPLPSRTRKKAREDSTRRQYRTQVKFLKQRYDELQRQNERLKKNTRRTGWGKAGKPGSRWTR